eukprot:SAG22_NODE_19124_length_278_cov_0.569832_2_plen_51_part_01
MQEDRNLNALINQVAELSTNVSQCMDGTASFVQYIEVAETTRRQLQEAQCH